MKTIGRQKIQQFAIPLDNSNTYTITARPNFIDELPTVTEKPFYQQLNDQKKKRQFRK